MPRLSERDELLIAQYLVDDVSPAERAEVERRLVEDADFAAEHRAQVGLVALLNDLPERPLPRSFTLTAAQVQAGPRLLPAAPRRPAWMGLASAAAVALLLGGGAVLLLRPPSEAVQVASASTQISSPAPTFTEADAAIMALQSGLAATASPAPTLTLNGGLSLGAAAEAAVTQADEAQRALPLQPPAAQPLATQAATLERGVTSPPSDTEVGVMAVTEEAPVDAMSAESAESALAQGQPLGVMTVTEEASFSVESAPAGGEAADRGVMTVTEEAAPAPMSAGSAPAGGEALGVMAVTEEAVPAPMSAESAPAGGEAPGVTAIIEEEAPMDAMSASAPADGFNNMATPKGSGSLQDALPRLAELLLRLLLNIGVSGQVGP